MVKATVSYAFPPSKLGTARVVETHQFNDEHNFWDVKEQVEARWLAMSSNEAETDGRQTVITYDLGAVVVITYEEG